MANCGGNLANVQNIDGYATFQVLGATGVPQNAIQLSMTCGRTSSGPPGGGLYGTATQVYLAQ